MHESTQHRREDVRTGGPAYIPRIYGVTSTVGHALQHLTIARIKQFCYDRRLLKQGRLSAKEPSRGKPNQSSAARYDARAVRVIDFEKILAQLPSLSQQLIWLRYGDGQGIAECAAIVGRAERTTAHLTRLAVCQLALKLDEADLL